MQAGIHNESDKNGQPDLSSFLRRFIRSSECNQQGDVWTVHAPLFQDPNYPELSLHAFIDGWTQSDVESYAAEYTTSVGKVPGVLQIHCEAFNRASLPAPYLQDDEADVARYRNLHCAWPCPSLQKAHELADVVTMLIAMTNDSKVWFKFKKAK